MPDMVTISADYTLRPSELANTLSILVAAQQPCIVWGPPGCAKSEIAQQVAAVASREYIDVRALLLDPVDLRGIPWRDSNDSHPLVIYRPPSSSTPALDQSQWLIEPRRAENLPCPWYRRRYITPSLTANAANTNFPPAKRKSDAATSRHRSNGVSHGMRTRLASRFVHLEIRVDTSRPNALRRATNGIAPRSLVFHRKCGPHSCTASP